MKSAAQSMLAIAGFAAAALFAAGDALGCQCRHRMEDLSVCRSFARFDAVFIGTVTKIVPGDVIATPRKPTVVKVKAEQWFKGKRVPVVEVLTAGASSMCGYSFEQGQSYLVYAGMHDGRLWTSGCDPTTKRSKAMRHLSYLEHPNRDTMTRLDGLWQTAGVGSVRGSVTASGASGAKAPTDARGRFQFNDLPPGKYTLSFEPGSEKISRRRNRLWCWPRALAPLSSPGAARRREESLQSVHRPATSGWRFRRANRRRKTLVAMPSSRHNRRG
jgi:hypothetical protein